MDTGKSPVSSFTKDPSGLWHYNNAKFLADIYKGIDDAIENRPLDGPSWFWWSGTFAPIELDDTPQTLFRRWSIWREDFQRDPKTLLEHLEVYSTNTTEQ